MAMLPWGKIAEAAQTGVGSTVALGSGLVASSSRANVAERKQLKSDINAQKRGLLGMSEAAQNQVAAAGLQAAQASQATARDAIQQQAAATGGPSAASMQALGALGQGAANAGAESRGQASAMSTEVAQQRDAQVRNAISQAANKNRAGAKHYGQLAGQSASAGAKFGGEQAQAQQDRNVDQAYTNAYKKTAVIGMNGKGVQPDAITQGGSGGTAIATSLPGLKTR